MRGLFRILPVAILGLSVLGCSGSGSDTGDEEAGRKAAETTVKSVDQLPDNMPAQAKAQAEAAIKQQEQRNAADAAGQEGRLKAARGGQ